MVAKQTLNLLERVRILHPQPNLAMYKAKLRKHTFLLLQTNVVCRLLAFLTEIEMRVAVSKNSKFVGFNFENATVSKLPKAFRKSDISFRSASMTCANATWLQKADLICRRVATGSQVWFRTKLLKVRILSAVPFKTESAAEHGSSCRLFIA